MTNPMIFDLRGIASRVDQLLAEEEIGDVISIGGQVGALLARTNDRGARAWTLAQAAEHVECPLDVALAAYALWHGVLAAYSLHSADLRIAELARDQLDLVAEL